ncbi:MAG: PfaD family polyunsaturated fatty acid/polyketide biosynthesis protein [Planctomycetota bacterium]|jgi:PfaD family protein|nr:PfaD family polyunsaturated fatty acid/polyketide biosynthesis protein [Planctomycetota bacterium]
MGHQRGKVGFQTSLGNWYPTDEVTYTSLDQAMEDLDQAYALIADRSGSISAVRGGRVELETHTTSDATSGADSGSVRALVGWLSPTPHSSLGSPGFQQDHGTSCNYVAGSMANGIASVELVGELARIGILSFYGAAGQTPATILSSLHQLKKQLPGRPWGCNLIHSPSEPSVEQETSRMLVKEQVPCVEASAFLDITEPLVRMRLQTLQRAPSGEITSSLRVMAKASRLEVARKFLSPAPAAMISSLLESGEITADQAQWARSMPLCDDITAEADSGGHTDNRPMATLVPAFSRLRDEIALQVPATGRVRIGAAGGLGTPDAICAALALGADYFVIGSVHQACVESGSSDVVRSMLAAAGPADVIMAPASDMFEMGVHLQVLRSGTLFGPRAKKLLELYRNYNSLDQIPAAECSRLEKDLFRMPIDQVWQQTRSFFLQREPAQVERANQDPHHQMALVFRWYLGLSSEWANCGDLDRKLDYQIWCGPAMGAFNEWTRGSWLEAPDTRRVADVARALLQGAANSARHAHLLRQGLVFPAGSIDRSPVRVSESRISSMRTPS